jgi:GDP-4-dehydro-6-deoxy-D-mannose reductase
VARLAAAAQGTRVLSRALVTGAGGFVGSHLVERLAGEHEVIGIARHGEATPGVRSSLPLDLADADATRRAVEQARPDLVFHLAAQASVRRSWDAPRETIEANVALTLNVLEAVRAAAPEATVVVVGSGEEYGPVPDERLPVTEDEPLRPQNPYAVSKASADLAAGFYADAHGLRVVRTRAFNPAGPRQTDAYVVAAFARQIAEAEAAGGDSLVIETGNLAPRRDFTDVRDVVRAYDALAARGEPGVFNVCSGVSTPAADILAGLAALTPLRVEQRTDPSRLRKHEVMDIRGSHDRLTGATGWQPEIPLEQTLADTLDWWRAEVAR